MGLGTSLLPCLLAATASGGTPTNVLVILVDDVGVDLVGSYGVSADVPPTPNFDALAAQGVRFTAAWATPMCSPTRACIQTGRLPFRTGMGNVSDSYTTGAFTLPYGETTLPEALDLGASGYAHAAFGKWHLAGPGDPLAVIYDDSPNLAGFSHFSGALSNFGSSESYFQWRKVTNGVRSMSTNYATTDQVDDALAWIEDAPEPWFCYLAFSAAHTPLHAPPAALHTQDLTGAGSSETPRQFVKAMWEAVDTEVGRLLDGLGSLAPRTVVVYLGDNGTTGGSLPPPYDPTRGKITGYELGVRVPLVVAGPLVTNPGSTSDELVHAVDVFATVLEIAGVDPASVVPPSTTLDSQSLVPILDGTLVPGTFRTHLFTELFSPNGWAPTRTVRAIRDARFKLLRQEFPPAPIYDELYDLALDPFELNDLLGAPLDPLASAANASLSSALDAQLAELTAFGYGAAGSGGFVPALTSNPTPALGSRLDLIVSGGHGGTLGWFGFALGQQSSLFFGTTLLLPTPLYAVLPHMLSGTGFGDGRITESFPPLGPSLAGTSVYVQAMYYDPGALEGLSATNGLLVAIP